MCEGMVSLQVGGKLLEEGNSNVLDDTCLLYINTATELTKECVENAATRLVYTLGQLDPYNRDMYTWNMLLDSGKHANGTNERLMKEIGNSSSLPVRHGSRFYTHHNRIDLSS